LKTIAFPGSGFFFWGGTKIFESYISLFEPTGNCFEVDMKDGAALVTGGKPGIIGNKQQQ
jgi:hypothetical protein